jgi:hypothetical protein
LRPGFAVTTAEKERNAMAAVRRLNGEPHRLDLIVFSA